MPWAWMRWCWVTTNLTAGLVFLGAYLEAACFPVLAANVVTTDPALVGRLRPFVVLERAGLCLGVVGVTTPRLW